MSDHHRFWGIAFVFSQFSRPTSARANQNPYRSILLHQLPIIAQWRILDVCLGLPACQPILYQLLSLDSRLIWTRAVIWYWTTKTSQGRASHNIYYRRPRRHIVIADKSVLPSLISLSWSVLPTVIRLLNQDPGSEIRDFSLFFFYLDFETVTNFVLGTQPHHLHKPDR